MPPDQQPGPEPSRRARWLATGLAPAGLVVLVVLVVALVVVARPDERSTGSPSVPVSTATESSPPAPTQLQPGLGRALQPVAPDPSCSTRPPQVLRVLQFNIRSGLDDEGEVDLTRIAAEIEAADPDLVSLNEVDDGTLRSGGTNEASYLSRATGLHAVFGLTLPSYDGGRFGNAILSRYPILESHKTVLPEVSGYEPRALVTVTVEVGRRRLSFSSLHLSAGGERGAVDRALEARVVAQVLQHAQLPTVLAGDLNSPPTDPPVRILRQYLLDAQEQAGTGLGETIPEADPTTRIDYVLYDDHFAPVAGSTQVLRSAVSDHRAVLTELALRPEGC